MIPEEKLKEIKELLDESKSPLFFFDDDADGVSSFLLCYDYVKKGHGVIVNMSPHITAKHLRKVKEYNPDLVVILDLADVDQEFIDNCPCKVLWIEHHQLMYRSEVYYYNPRMWAPENNWPVTYWIYRALGGPVWIATLGSVGDWHMPDFLQEFKIKYPDLMEKETVNPEKALFESRFSLLFNIYSFNFKGSASEALKSVKVLTRIKSPYEILEQKTKEGKYIYKKFEKVNKEYQELLKKVNPEGKSFLYFEYKEKSYSFTSEISNYLIAKNPEKLILVARRKNNEMVCSFRSSNLNSLNILEKSLEGVEGHGGGHEKACGAVIKIKDFEKFLENVKKSIL